MIKERFNYYVQDLETYIMFYIKETVAKITPELEAKKRAPIALSMGAPTAAPPEFVINKLKSILNEEGIHTYSSPKGETYFRQAVKERMKRRFNVELDADKEIFSLIGSKEGLANIIRILIDPVHNIEDRDIIMLPDPGYASYKEMVKVSGGRAYSLPLTKENNYMPNLETSRENMIKEGYNPNKLKAVVINYPNNPLGCTMTREYAKTVVDFCKKYNLVLISDTAYADLYFNESDKPFSILEIEGAKDCAVEFFSFSKPYAMTGWRLGWICGNSEIISIFGKLKSTLDTGVFRAIQKAGAEILLAKEGDEYIKEKNIGFKKKQDIFVKGLKELGWENINVPDATFYLWLPIPPRYKTSKEFTDDLLRTSGVVVVPGSGFGKYGEGFFRASIVCSDEKLQECIDRMKADGFYFNK